MIHISNESKWLDIRNRIIDRYLTDTDDLLVYHFYPNKTKTSPWDNSRLLDVVYLNGSNVMCRTTIKVTNQVKVLKDVPLGTIWISPRGEFDQEDSRYDDGVLDGMTKARAKYGYIEKELQDRIKHAEAILYSLGEFIPNGEEIIPLNLYRTKYPERLECPPEA